jgi:2'-hydroxyisoflavone reductase
LNVLILGGTVFLGRHLVEAARAAGHSVTLFNRGQSRPEAFPDIEQLRGDRTDGEGLAPLAGRAFDAVIDTCGYVPRIVGESARTLSPKVTRYCFISSVSVYKDWPEEPCDETAAVATTDDPTTETVTGETYGPLKALCEDVVRAVYGERALIVRPGLIVGPHDPSDRFTYWPHRVARGGDVLAFDDPAFPTQWIDVRDLAAWTIRLLESGVSGTFNADGEIVALGDLLRACQAAAGSDARITYVAEDFLRGQAVGEWIELPLWIPGLRSKTGQGATVLTRAHAAGLSHRPLAETVADTLAWDRQRDGALAWKRTLTPEKEAQVLAAWRESGRDRGATQ